MKKTLAVERKEKEMERTCLAVEIPTNLDKAGGLVREAALFAADAHRGVLRKDKKTPYVMHPFRVCEALLGIFGVKDEKVLAAALLHDTMEDTGTDYDDLEKFFGCEVATMVALMSEDKRKPEAIRRALYLSQLKSSPVMVKLIKLADVYDNTKDAYGVGCAQFVKKTLAKGREYIETFKGSTDYKLCQAMSVVDALLRTKTNE